MAIVLYVYDKGQISDFTPLIQEVDAWVKQGNSQDTCQLPVFSLKKQKPAIAIAGYPNKNIVVVFRGNRVARSQIG